jgi:hypothetical protein
MCPLIGTIGGVWSLFNAKGNVLTKERERIEGGDGWIHSTKTKKFAPTAHVSGWGK